MKVKVAQLCLNLCNPMDYTIHEILQARILEWVAFPISRGSSQSRDQTQVSCIADRVFTSWATGVGLNPIGCCLFKKRRCAYRLTQGEESSTAKETGIKKTTLLTPPSLDLRWISMVQAPQSALLCPAAPETSPQPPMAVMETKWDKLKYLLASLIAHLVKTWPAAQETWVRFLGWKPLPLCTSVKSNLGDRVLLEAENNSFIVLPAKGWHSQLLLLQNNVSQTRRI